ncbi:MAG: L,D-transpeptidase family protein [Acidobacteria bacterium]|nr:L,D-transpeptidase family protein [Acidobacteriota bacterium]
MRIQAGIIALALTASVATGCRALHPGRGADKKSQQMDAALRKTLQGSARPTVVTADDEGARLWKLTRQFYERRQFAPAWIEQAKPRPQMDALIDAIKAAHQEGLDPELYNAALLDTRYREGSKGFLSQKGFDPVQAGQMDAWMTYLYMKFASDLADGLSDLARADPTWKIKPEKFDPLIELERALTENRVAESLAELTPKDPQYQALRKVLSEYRELQKKGGWPSVPVRMKVKPDQAHPAVTAVARRLSASGDFKGRVPAEGEKTAYSDDLREAVKRFQRRHGLQDDGVLSPAVAAEMNVPIDRRIRQLELNLERWRWLPRELGERHILVNIPEYRLEVWEGDRVPLSMRVVVGKEDTQTPIFNDEMTHIVFSPYWNVPPSIAQGETLPSVMKDPGFLDRTNMEVVDANGAVIDPASIDLNNPTGYRFRQLPGNANSLGLVKFMFPNQYNVYLHDTPADSLFARASRSFSHGCVRIEQPQALAEYLLRDQSEWTSARIQEAMHAQEERHVKLREPVPVYLGYFTARVSADGVMQFRKDVYEVDGRLTARLADRLERLRKAAAAAAIAQGAPAARPSGL